MDINKIKKPIYTDDRSDSHLDRPHLIQRAQIPDNYLEQIFSMPINGYHFDYLDQGYPKEAAYKFSKQDVQKAQELYEQNNPTHKSYQQGGTLAS